MTKFHFDCTQGSKEISKKFVNVTKTQKSRYLESETFFLQIKKLFNYTSRATYGKNAFVVEET